MGYVGQAPASAVVTNADLDADALIGTDIKIGEDAQTIIDFETANEIHFDADNAERVKIDATGLNVVSGSIETETIDYTDGDLAMTIADGGGVTFAQAVDLGSNTLTTTGSLQVRTIDYSDGDLAITIADGGGTTFAQAVDLGSNTLTTTGSLQVRTIDYSDGDLAITIADGGGTTFAQAVDLGSNTLTSTGSMQIRTIDYSDGDLAMTIADGGGVTFAQDATFSGDVALADDKVINLGEAGKIDFGDEAPADNAATGIVFSFIAGATLAIGDVVYMHTDGEVAKADADAVTSMPAIGICVGSGTDGNAVDVLVQGIMHDTSAFDTFTVGADIFVSTTAGAVTATAPSGSGDTVQKVGVALHADMVYFNFNTTEVLLA